MHTAHSKLTIPTSGSTNVTDVVLDPLLSAKMRDHQKAGVKVSCVNEPKRPR
jgi:hypothetical protein